MSDTIVSPSDTIVSPSDTIVSPSDTIVSPSDTIVSPSDTIVSPSDTIETPLIKFIPRYPWIYEQIIANNGDLVINCRECMTSVNYEITVEKQKEYDDQLKVYDYNDESSQILKLLDIVKNIKRCSEQSWKILGYCGVMHLDWAQSLLTALEILSTNTPPPKPYFYIYQNLKIDIPLWEDKIVHEISEDLVDSCHNQ
jgi:hypothetical protein